MLTSIMEEAVPEWKKIGCTLGFLDCDLTLIEANPTLTLQGPTGYFEEMLNQWLKWAPPEHDWPSLEILEDALQNIGQTNLATKLRPKFLQKKKKGSG